MDAAAHDQDGAPACAGARVTVAVFVLLTLYVIYLLSTLEMSSSS